MLVGTPGAFSNFHCLDDQGWSEFQRSLSRKESGCPWLLWLRLPFWFKLEPLREACFWYYQHYQILANRQVKLWSSSPRHTRNNAQAWLTPIEARLGSKIWTPWRYLPSVEIRRELEIQLQHCLMVVAQRLLDFNPEQHWKLSHMNMRR